MNAAAIRQLAIAISDDLYDAVVFYEVFRPSGHDAHLIARINQAQVHPAFNAISTSLQLGVIGALCRIWDKTGGTARIPEVSARLRKNPALVADQAALAKWLVAVEAVEASENLKILREFRNARLAHRGNPNRPDHRAPRTVRRVREGDEGNLLRATIPIVDQLHGFVGYKPDLTPVIGLTEAWGQQAIRFWARVAATPSK